MNEPCAARESELPMVAGRKCYIEPSAFSGRDHEFYIGDGRGCMLNRDGSWGNPSDLMDAWHYWPSRADAEAFVRTCAARESQAEPVAASEQRPDGAGWYLVDEPTWPDGLVRRRPRLWTGIHFYDDDGMCLPVEQAKRLGNFKPLVPASELADLKAKLEDAEREIAKLRYGDSVWEKTDKQQLELIIKQRDQLAAAEQRAERFTKGLKCFSCEVELTTENADENCHMAHREEWGHEWVGERVFDLTSRLVRAIAELDRLNGLLAKREADRAEGWPELPTFSGKAKRKRNGEPALFYSDSSGTYVFERGTFCRWNRDKFADLFEVIQPEAGE